MKFTNAQLLLIAIGVALVVLFLWRERELFVSHMVRNKTPHNLKISFWPYDANAAWVWPSIYVPANSSITTDFHGYGDEKLRLIVEVDGKKVMQGGLPKQFILPANMPKGKVVNFELLVDLESGHSRVVMQLTDH